MYTPESSDYDSGMNALFNKRFALLEKLSGEDNNTGSSIPDFCVLIQFREDIGKRESIWGLDQDAGIDFFFLVQV